MKRAALYLRVSTDEQTVENQRPPLLQIAKQRGLEVVATYEENVSAAKARPAFDRMMADAHAGTFDVLIIWAIDRFGRSMIQNLQAVLALDAAHVTIISARESWLELQGPARQLLIGVFSWVAEQERTRLSERTIAGMTRAKAQGKQIGRPKANAPIGVLLSLAAAGETQRAIARKLGVSQAVVSRALAAKRGPADPDGPARTRVRDAKGGAPGGGGKPPKLRLVRD